MEERKKNLSPNPKNPITDSIRKLLETNKELSSSKTSERLFDILNYLTNPNKSEEKKKSKKTLKKIKKALLEHRLNMLDLSTFNKCFTFQNLKQFKKSKKIEVLEIINLFIKCQLELRMCWIYVLSEEKLGKLEPSERNMIRKVNRSSNYYKKVKDELGLDFPLQFLKNYMNLKNFKIEKKLGSKVFSIGFRMVVSFLRSGFYRFEDMVNLLNFIRQKIRFLKSLKEESTWKDEGQWFMIKFVKQCLYILIDHAYFLLKKKRILDEKNLKENQKKTRKKISKKKKEKEIFCKKKEEENKNGCSVTNSEEILSDEIEVNILPNYNLDEDTGLKISELLDIIREYDKEISRQFDETYILLREIFANAVLGWGASGKIAKTHKFVDYQILELCEIFFEIRPVVSEILCTKKNNFLIDEKSERRVKAVMMQLDDILIELKFGKFNFQKKNELFTKISEILNVLLSSNFTGQYLVHVAFITKNLIELLISIHYYLDSKGKNMLKNRKRKFTISPINFQIGDTLKKISEKSKKKKRKSSKNFTLEDDNENWEEVITKVIKLSSKSSISYTIVSDDFTLWQLIKTFPHYSFKAFLNCGLEIIYPEADRILSFIYGAFTENSFFKLKKKSQTELKFTLLYSIQILKKIILFKRKKSAYMFQFEIKCFNLILKIFFILRMEEYFEKVLHDVVEFNFISINNLSKTLSKGKNVGYLMFENLFDSKLIDSDSTLDSILLYKFLDFLKTCSSRFYSVNFDTDEEESDVMKLIKYIFKWTHMLDDKFTLSKDREDITLGSTNFKVERRNEEKKKILRIMKNQNIVPLFSILFRLQTNIFLKAPNNLIDSFDFGFQLPNSQKKNCQICSIFDFKIYEVIKNNYRYVMEYNLKPHLISTDKKERKIYQNLIKGIMEQIIITICFIETMSECYDFDQLFILENLLDVLGKMEKNLLFSEPSLATTPRGNIFHETVETEKELQEIDKILETKILHLVDTIENCGLSIDLEELQKSNIFENETNQSIFFKLTKHSNINKNNSENDEKFSEYLINCKDFECDIDDVLEGLSNLFIRAFGTAEIPKDDISRHSPANNVQAENGFYNFKNLEQREIMLNSDRKKETVEWNEHSNSYFFFNYSNLRFLIFFEKISFELKNFKKLLFENFNNIMKNQAAKESQNSMSTFENLFNLALRTLNSIEKSIFHNSDWTIIFSINYLLFSLLQNLTKQQFSEFQKIYGNFKFENPETTSFMLKKNTLLEYLVTWNTRLMEKMKIDEIEISKKMLKKSQISFPENLPLLKVTVDFMTSCVTGKGNKNHNSVTKCLNGLLLNILFMRMKDTPGDILSLKYSISKLTIEILRKIKFNDDDILMNLSQNGLELRLVYEYVINYTKLKLIKIIQRENLEVSEDFIRYKKKKEKKLNKKNYKSSLKHHVFNSVSKKFRASSKFIRKKKAQGSKKNIKKKDERFTKNSEIGFMGQMKKMSDLGKKLFKIQSIFTKNKDKKDTSMEIDYDKTFLTDLALMIQAYSMTTYINPHFKFITSLIILLNELELKGGGKYWSLRKREAIKFKSYTKFELSKMSESLKEELTIVSFLLKINREIEIMDWKGENRIILFRKYPEFVNVSQIVVEKLFEDFDGEMLLHKMMKLIPQILIISRYFHSFSIRSPMLYKLSTKKMLWNYRALIWTVSLFLNVVCLNSYIHSNSRETGIVTNMNADKYVIDTIAAFIGILALAQSLLWMYTKYIIIKQVNIEKFKLEYKSINPSSIISYFYIRIFKSIIFQETVISVMLHVLFSLLGIFYTPVYHAFHLIMFIFISKSIRTVLYAIVKNIKEMILIFIFAVFVIYIYSIITLIHYSDDFMTDETRDFDVCMTLWSCFFNVLNLGLRNGGGIAESMTQMYSTHYKWNLKVLYDLSFFVLINVIALNMIFGVIVDTFSELREKRSYLSKKIFLKKFRKFFAEQLFDL